MPIRPHGFVAGQQEALMTTRTLKPNPHAGYVPILGEVSDEGEVRLYTGARESLEARRLRASA
jgi:hypothetical protein